MPLVRTTRHAGQRVAVQFRTPQRAVIERGLRLVKLSRPLTPLLDREADGGRAPGTHGSDPMVGGVDRYLNPGLGLPTIEFGGVKTAPAGWNPTAAMASNRLASFRD